MTQADAAATYRRNAILTASPEKLIKMLYAGAIRHMESLRQALADPTQRRSAPAGVTLGKAMAIVSELRAALDMEAGGEIALNLDRLYDFVLDSLSRANVSRTPEPVDDALRVMRTLEEAWNAVVPG